VRRWLRGRTPPHASVFLQTLCDENDSVLALGQRPPRSGYAHALTSTQLCFHVLVINVGTLYTFCPLTLRAKEWIDEHVQDDAQWFGHALIVEHRYAWGLAQGMKDEGLELR
jgi:hypothetical protein